MICKHMHTYIHVQAYSAEAMAQYLSRKHFPLASISREKMFYWRVGLKYFWQICHKESY